MEESELDLPEMPEDSEWGESELELSEIPEDSEWEESELDLPEMPEDSEWEESESVCSEISEKSERENEEETLESADHTEQDDDEQKNEAQNENDDSGENENGGLTEEEKAKIKKETGWPDAIIECISSMKEFKIYKEANLIVAKIDGKLCLIRSDIDWNQKDTRGRTNRERAEQGLAPINKDGKVILHHIGQHSDSPLAELTQEEHRGQGNDTVLHDKSKVSEIDRTEFNKERSNHWQARAQQESE